MLKLFSGLKANTNFKIFKLQFCVSKNCLSLFFHGTKIFTAIGRETKQLRILHLCKVPIIPKTVE